MEVVWNADWKCPDMALSDVWGVVNSEQIDRWFGGLDSRSGITYNYNWGDFLYEGPSGGPPVQRRRRHRIYNPDTDTSVAIEDCIDDSVSDHSLNGFKSYIVSLDDVSQYFRNHLMPVMRLVHTSQPPAFCSRFIIELARLKALLYVGDIAPDISVSQQIADQRTTVDLWRLRCRTQRIFYKIEARATPDTPSHPMPIYGRTKELWISKQYHMIVDSGNDTEDNQFTLITDDPELCELIEKILQHSLTVRRGDANSERLAVKLFKNNDLFEFERDNNEYIWGLMKRRNEYNMHVSLWRGYGQFNSKGNDKLIASVGSNRLQSIVDSFKSIASYLPMLHAHGVFHTDLKQDNLTIDSEGRAFLIDWGNAFVEKIIDDYMNRDSTLIQPPAMPKARAEVRAQQDHEAHGQPRRVPDHKEP
ncbi:hypothetical protein GUITHDRAFT_109334 [Guillardia theta CCMP2712]|uniref:Protein kinase domain-containing protein n=1 Tax=Guillardia theta (strain CCMP2712) TaxID=905079 RepID=L1J9C9_GUITC|nr:hypothetical protein GUITHDRAFT_109334 [Guillardia theta CCMP2712]EKX44917.1 hypothetical protein GUITHDRAFT_109334 [Guillardia theta CCMP2712]|eukprot:XP_005831897.1 hypothetical protein GUITHDRAFT_109334 [Guillardia theta CCMP2712]